VQSQACLYKPGDLIERVTGSALSAQPLKDHLTHRYITERKAAAA
jgi:Zn-dependent M32 family carboxypeptidase